MNAAIKNDLLVRSSAEEMSSRLNMLVQKAVSAWNVRGIPRLLYATRHWLLGHDPALFDLGNGIRLFLNPEDYFQCMMFYGRYSPEILEVLEHFVRPGDIVVDVGAHVGYFSAHLSRLVSPGGCVYSFEPDPRAFDCLKISIEANKTGCIKTFPLALSASSGRIEFFLSPQLGWSTAVGGSHLAGLRPITVETIPLDNLVDQGHVSPHIRLVKIDVEGFEVEAILGMTRILETSRPILVMEVNGRLLAAQGRSCAGLLELIRSLGYEIYSIKKDPTWFWYRKGKSKSKEFRKTANLPNILTPETPKSGVSEGDVVCIPMNSRKRRD